MLNRLFRMTFDFAHRKANQSAAWAVFARDTVNGFITTAHHALMILGISAIAALAMMFVKPEITDHLKALSPFTEAIAEDRQPAGPIAGNLMDAPSKSFTQAPSASEETHLLTADESKIVSTHPQQQRVTSWLSKRYRVASDATDMLVSAAYLTAMEIKLDPLLILAVMAIESGFNPFAESPVGAQGLMQVMSKIHHEKFEDMGGIKAALNPVANIKVGSLILKDYVTRAGSIEAGLKLYVGAAAFDSDFGYGSRVLAEYRRLKDVAIGKKVPVFSTPTNASAEKPKPTASKSDDAASDVQPDADNQTTATNEKTDQVAAL
jgi:soluble lytic murein transglycosylase-like protein